MYVPGKGPGLHLSGVRWPTIKKPRPTQVAVYTYVRTYIHTPVHVAALNLPGLCPVLSCPVLLYASRKKAIFAASTTTSTPAVCPALPALQRTTLHCTILHCAVPWAACIRRVCCRVPSHYHRPGPHFLSPIHRLHANVIVSIVPGPALCHGYLVIYPLTQPGGVRASNPYLLVRDMNEDRPHTGR